MEHVLEALLEVIIDGSWDVGTSRKIPMVFRILALLALLAIYGGLSVMLLIYGIQAFCDGDMFGGMLCTMVAVGILAGAICVTIRKMRENSQAE